MRREWPSLALVLVVLLSCASGPTPSRPTGVVPAWMESYPVAPLFFIGIGGSPDTGDREGDLERARAKALAQLASEIEVTVRSDQTFRETHSSRGESTTTADIIVQALTAAKLQGVELVDSFHSQRDGYWFYFRLEKRTWDWLKNRDMYELRDRVLGMVEQASAPGASISDRLMTLSSALGAVSGSRYAGKISCEIDGKRGVLDDLVGRKIRESLSAMRLSVEPAAVQYTPGGTAILRIQVSSSEEGPVGALSLELRDPTSAVVANLRTDETGLFSGAVRFTGLKSGSHQLAVALAPKTFEGADHSVLDAGPQGLLGVDVRPLGIHVRLAGPDDLDARWLQDSLSSILVQRFALGILQENDPTPLRISFTVRTRNAPANDYGIAFSYCSVAVTAARDGSQIATFTSTEAKGAGNTSSQAARKAAKAMLEALTADRGLEEVIQTLIANALPQGP